jgi:hypothetical protein
MALAIIYLHEGKSCRSFVEWLNASDLIMRWLDMKKVPHFTTIPKFIKRIPPGWIHALMDAAHDDDEPHIVAIDSTGFKLGNASQHYVTRMTELGAKKTPMKHFLKLSIGVDTDTQLIAGHKVRRGPASDHRDFAMVASRTVDAMSVSSIVADKGYDSEANHQFARRMLGVESVIPPRCADVPISRTHGKFRKLMKRSFNSQMYNMRPIVETVNSVLKRVLGETVLSRSVAMQNRTLQLKLVAYNVHRLARCGG